jgi:hypothetical protein
LFGVTSSNNSFSLYSIHDLIHSTNQENKNLPSLAFQRTPNWLVNKVGNQKLLWSSSDVSSDGKVVEVSSVLDSGTGASLFIYY